MHLTHWAFNRFPCPIRLVPICPPRQTSTSVPSQSESLQFSTGITRGNDPRPKHRLHQQCSITITTTHPYKPPKTDIYMRYTHTENVKRHFILFFSLLFTYIWGEYTEMDRRTSRAMLTCVWQKRSDSGIESLRDFVLDIEPSYSGGKVFLHLSHN